MVVYNEILMLILYVINFLILEGQIQIVLKTIYDIINISPILISLMKNIYPLEFVTNS